MTYKECKSCSNRTEFTCIRCGFCWSCHWKVEQIDKNELLATGQDEPIHLKNYILSIQPQEIKKSERHQRSVDQVVADITTNVIDVFGNEMELFATIADVTTSFQFMDLENVFASVSIHITVLLEHSDMRYILL